MTDDHDHDHDHDRTVAPMVDEITDFEVLEIALRELCIEKGLFTAEDHRRFTEFAEHIGPTPAAHMVARAWLDPEYKKLVLADAMAASREVGVDWLQPTGFGTPSDFTALHVLEDTPDSSPRDRAARCARAIRDRFWAIPRSGTAPPTIAAASCGGHARCSPNSGSICPKTSPSGWRIPTRNTVSW